MSWGAFFSGSNPYDAWAARASWRAASTAPVQRPQRVPAPGCVLHVLECPCAVCNGLLDVCLGNAYAWANKLRVCICLTLSAGVIVVISVLVMVATVMVTVMSAMPMALVIIWLHASLLVSNLS